MHSDGPEEVGVGKLTCPITGGGGGGGCPFMEYDGLKSTRLKIKRCRAREMQFIVIPARALSGLRWTSASRLSSFDSTLPCLGLKIVSELRKIWIRYTNVAFTLFLHLGIC